jgi:hypothetical protein
VLLRRLQPPLTNNTTSYNNDDDGSLLSRSAEHECLRLLLALLTSYGETLKDLGVPRGTTVHDNAKSIKSHNVSTLAISLLDYARQPCVVALQCVGATSRCLARSIDAPTRQGTDDGSLLVLDSLRRQVWNQATTVLLYLLQSDVWKERWTPSPRVTLIQSLVATLPVTSRATPTLDRGLQETTQRLYYAALQEALLWGKQDDGTTASRIVGAALGEVGGGAVVARLLETCLPTNDDIDVRRGGGSSPDLVTASYACVQAMIGSIPDAALWQRLFPGTFYALYKSVVVPRQAAPRTNRQSTATGLAALVALLQAVVAAVPSDSLSPDGGLPQGTATGAAAFTAVQAWQSRAAGHSCSNQKNATMDSGQTPLVATAAPAAHDIFWTRVAQNLAVPLQRLVVQCRRKDSRVAWGLVRLLLESWCSPIEACLTDKHVPSWQALQDTLLDTCVSLTQQEGDLGVASQARSFLTEHSNERRLAGLQDRWESLWEDWLADTMSQRWKDWEDRLQILTGYLRFLRPRDVQAFLMSKEDSLATCLWSTLWTVDWPTLTAQWRDASSTVSTNLLPWKYLDEHRHHTLESFLSELAKQLGPRSSAVLVDDYVGHVARQISPSMDITSQAIGLLQVAHGFISCIQGTAAKNQRSLEMLTQFTLPVVLTLLSRVDRPILTEPLQVKGFAAFDASLLRVVTSFAVTSVNAERLRSVCLFPVLTRYACPNWAVTEYTALETLEGMADACIGDECSRLESVVVSSIETILSTSLARLRIDLNSPELAETIQTTAMALRIACPLFKNKGDETRVNAVLALAREVISVSMARFDVWTRHATDRLDATLVFVDFFDADIAFLAASVKAHLETSPSELSTSITPSVGDDWLRLLDDFRTKTIGKGVANENCSRPANGARAASKYETDLIAKIVSIGSYLLSHQSLRVQTAICTLLSNCFSLLLEISRLPKATVEEVNGAQNAILRHIADCWPSLAARAKATLLVLRAPTQSTFLVIATNPSDAEARRTVDMGPSRLFLSQLFNLVAGMVEASGDFMSTRVRETTWPWIDQVLLGAATKNFSVFGDQGTSAVLLLESALDCVNRIFIHRATALPLAGLIPSVGRRLVALLDSDEAVAKRVTSTMESLARVDSDALLRPMSMVGGLCLPESPFRLRSSDDAVLLLAAEPTAQAQQLARGLLKFIDDQPEQIVEYI